jgi:hypothetical protein
VIRLLIWLALAIGLVVCGSTVKLGSRTFFGHVRAIWATEEAKDMRDGIKGKAGPVVDKVKRGAKAGWDEATKEDAKGSARAGSGSASLEAPTVTP